MRTHTLYYIIGSTLRLLIHLFLDSLELVTHVEVVVDTSQSDHVVALVRFHLVCFLKVRKSLLEQLFCLVQLILILLCVVDHVGLTLLVHALVVVNTTQVRDRLDILRVDRESLQEILLSICVIFQTGLIYTTHHVIELRVVLILSDGLVEVADRLIVAV